jgi:hypothetical protein
MLLMAPTLIRRQVALLTPKPRDAFRLSGCYGVRTSLCAQALARPVYCGVLQAGVSIVPPGRQSQPPEKNCLTANRKRSCGYTTAAVHIHLLQPNMT